jgi:hypothetical protein
MRRLYSDRSLKVRDCDARGQAASQRLRNRDGNGFRDGYGFGLCGVLLDDGAGPRGRGRRLAVADHLHADDEAVSPLGHRLDVARLTDVVAQRIADLGDALRQAFLGHADTGPDGRQDLVAGRDPSRPRRQEREHFHALRAQADIQPVPLDTVQAGPYDHAGNPEVLVEHANWAKLFNQNFRSIARGLGNEMTTSAEVAACEPGRGPERGDGSNMGQFPSTG